MIWGLVVGFFGIFVWIYYIFTCKIAFFYLKSISMNYVEVGYRGVDDLIADNCRHKDLLYIDILRQREDLGREILNDRDLLLNVILHQRVILFM